jgi:hypothetical protein
MRFSIHPYTTFSERQTTTILDFLGDLGGFFEALCVSVGVLIAWIPSTLYSLNLISKLFSEKKP